MDEWMGQCLDRWVDEWVCGRVGELIEVDLGCEGGMMGGLMDE